ncbi:WD repeat-containing [Lecanosticta acicola]|uniref:WD repeat-containing n=1 Tax=Lecanosticta acicola TaxID=111012 RepID=A0AAI9E5D8_9PEZI|nr:WD repeat-containing [Lecanosticta acicola]
MPSATPKVRSLRWSSDGNQMLVLHEHGVQVMDSHHRVERVRLENGSGGLGHIESADFIGDNHLLTVWEFGRTKLWYMNNGKAVDLPDVKTTCDGRVWQIRPRSPPLLALLSRNGAEDCLVLHVPLENKTFPIVKLPTVDAQSISWSLDGRWLLMQDTPTATATLHIYTPHGCLFRSYPSPKDAEGGLGIKSTAWSPDGGVLALAKYDGRVELLNTKTFSPIAVIEHNTTIHQRGLSSEEQAPIWQEMVSAANLRTYSLQSQPVSPPLSKTKADSSEPKALGIAEMYFNCDGSFLATRDCRMLNTVWLWNMSTLAAHAVVIQHSNVRSLQWHPTRPETLLIDCAEGMAHIFDVSSTHPPAIFSTDMRPKAPLTWLTNPAAAKPIILITEATRFRLLHPEGKDDDDATDYAATPRAGSAEAGAAQYEEGASEDSLFDVLSGRKPLPPKTQPSLTETLDLEMEEEDSLDGAAELEDTFREKRKVPEVIDPLDDSEIF